MIAKHHKTPPPHQPAATRQPEAPAQPRGAALTALAILLPCLLAVAVYFWGLNGLFVLDDQTQVIENPYVGNGSIARELFSRAYFSRSGEIGYRPVLTLDYALERMLWSRWADPEWGYHLTNLLLHLGNVVLVFALARRVLGLVWPASVAAIVFAVHPINSEVVAVLTFRDDSLSLLFLLGGVLLFARGERTGRRWASGLVASLLFLLAAFTKEQAAVFPLALIAWWLAFERDRKRVHARSHHPLLPYVPYALAVAIFLIVRVEMSGFQERVAGTDQLPFVARLVAAPRVLVHYLGMLAFPMHQSSYYPALAWQREALGWVNGLSWLVVVGLVVLTMIGFRRWRVLGFCGAWFFIMALPVANLAAINNFAAYDRYLYATCAVFGIGVAAAMRRAHAIIGPGTMPRAALWGLVGLWTATLGLRTVDRVLVWRDGVSFWPNALLVSPDVRYLHNGYGTALNRTKRLAAAAEQFRKAIAMADKTPEGLPKAPDSFTNLGVYYSTQGNYEQAVDCYQKALKVEPSNRDALRGLVEVYQKRGEWARAVEEYRRFLTVYPDNAEVTNNLADLYINDPLKSYGSAQTAIKLATEACELTQWGRWEMILTLGEAHYASGQRDKAISYGERALRLAPEEEVIQQKLRTFKTGIVP